MFCVSHVHALLFQASRCTVPHTVPLTSQQYLPTQNCLLQPSTSKTHTDTWGPHKTVFSSQAHQKHTRTPEARAFKESAEQRFPLSVFFFAQPLPYFRQPLRSLSSLFSRRCHRCRSREHSGGSCQQRVVICWNHVIHALLQINYVDCWRVWWMTNTKSNAITRNVRILYQIKHTGGPRQEFTNTMATAAQRLYVSLLCI